MKGLQLHVQDFDDSVEIETNQTNPTTCFDAMEEETAVCGGHEEDREIWLGREEEEDLLDVNDSSIFYGDFPPLPDFSCMSSSSSSSSSTPAPVKAIASSSASSSSSAASWAVLKSDGEEDIEKKNQHDQVEPSTAALSSTASMEFSQDQEGLVGCVDVMETFGYTDLIESNEFFDPSSIFNPDENFLEEFQQQDLQLEQQPQKGNDIDHDHEQMIMQATTDQENSSSEDLAMVFLEWLKSNKETVSAEDLRRVKIKKATIECAAKRLGGGKEAMKQLLKLILEWVQTNHLQKRRIKESSCNDLQCQNPNPILQNPISPDPSITPCFTQSPWIPPPPPPPAYVTDPGTIMPGYPPMMGYMGDPFGNGAPHSYPPPPDYHMLESAQSWPPSQFGLASHYASFPEHNLQPVQAHPGVFTGYGNQYPCQFLPGQVGDRLVSLGSSATKEARKKRMARQRRLLSHHRNQNHHNSQQNQSLEHHAMLGNDNNGPQMAQANPGNWVYWSTPPVLPPASTSPAALPMDTPSVQTVDKQAQNQRSRQVASDRRQNWKPEKNLRFLLQKVLKQSDVGNLGRIVLPKKEAETHLPELEARDGISLAMEDIGTSRVWNMRYRFWPNNKSRMYLLENTGDFVRTNGLQEGDFIVIYSDVKCGKYLIRGVKVRQPGTKSENKKAGKSQKNTHASSPAAAVNNGSSSLAMAAITNQNQAQTVK